LNVPVLALAQLSRAVESRQSKVPQLSDLRESGCLTGDTLVYLPDSGTYKPVEQLVSLSGFNALALNTETWKLEPREVTKAFATGYKPVYKMTTRLGRSIRATANHQFLTIHGWQRLDMLSEGMRIALPRHLEGPTEASMSDAELALLGHLIGDGCTLPKHAIQYTTHELELAELVVGLAKEVFGDAVTPRINKERDWYQVYLPPSYHLTYKTHNPIVTWLNKMGVFGLRSYEKRIPDVVFAQPDSGIACFLRHLWSTDGCINQKKILHQTAIIESLVLVPTNTNRDILPREIWRLMAVPAMQLASITSRQMQARLENAFCGTSLYKQNLSRERGTRLAQVVRSDELTKLSQSDVYWDEIISIEPDGEAEVYDLTVDGLHNFVAGDIVVHNSIEQDADIVMFIYRDDVYNQDTEKKNIADIIVAKHRNGPLDEVSLYFQASQTRFRDLEVNQTIED
jgi:intein/homing endonuclease